MAEPEDMEVEEDHEDTFSSILDEVALRDGFASAQGELNGFNAIVRPTLQFAVTSTSMLTVTIAPEAKSIPGWMKRPTTARISQASYPYRNSVAPTSRSSTVQ